MTYHYRCNKDWQGDNWRISDILPTSNTNDLKKADFFFSYHFLLCRNGSVIVIFDLLFAQWVSDENIKEELIQGIEANKSSQLVAFHIDVNSIDITGICEYYLIFFESLSYKIKIQAMYRGSPGITLCFKNLSY